MAALAFTLELVDKVSANAKKATESVRKIEEQGKKTAKALDFSGDVAKTQAALDKIAKDPAGYKKLLQLQKKLRDEQAKIRAELNKPAPQGFFASFSSKLPFRTIGQYTQAAMAGALLADGVMRAGGFLVDSAHKVVDIIVDGFKKGIEAGSKQEVLRLGERLSLGKGAGAFAADADRFAGMTGFDDDAIRSMLLPLRRAGFDQQAARSAFAGAADIAAGLGKGGDQSAVAEALDVFTKIKLKGGIGEKQLVGLGVSPKAVYEDIAKQLSIGVAAAEKKVADGKIDDPQRIINAILRGVEKTQGGKLGTGSIEYSKTFEAKWRKITELPENYLKKLVDSPAWGKLTEAATRFLEFMNPDGPTGQKIFAALESAFSRIVGWIDGLASEGGLATFGASLQTIVGIAESLVSAVSTVVDLLREAAKIAEVVAGPLAKIIGSSQASGYAEAAKRGAQVSASQAVGFAQFASMWGLTDMATPAPRAATASTRGGRSTTVAPQINVSVAGDVKNPEDTGRRVGRAAAPDIHRAAERARNEAGT
jgi:hypothetical protein